MANLTSRDNPRWADRCSVAFVD